MSRRKKQPQAWTAAHEVALVCMVVDAFSPRVTVEVMKESFGFEVTERELRQWQQTPLWSENQAKILDQIRNKVSESGIANRVERIHRRNQSWAKLRTIHADRGEFYRKRRLAGDTSVPPGAETGLLIPVPVKDGTKWIVDKAALDAMESLEKDTAIELGQVEPTSTGRGMGGGGGMVLKLETGDAIPSYALGTAVDALETAFALMANGLMPELPEDCERMAFTLARRMCGWRDDEPWHWAPGILKAIKSAAWSLPAPEMEKRP